MDTLAVIGRNLDSEDNEWPWLKINKNHLNSFDISKEVYKYVYAHPDLAKGSLQISYEGFDRVLYIDYYTLARYYTRCSNSRQDITLLKESARLHLKNLKIGCNKYRSISEIDNKIDGWFQGPAH